MAKAASRPNISVVVVKLPNTRVREFQTPRLTVAPIERHYGFAPSITVGVWMGAVGGMERITSIIRANLMPLCRFSTVTYSSLLCATFNRARRLRSTTRRRSTQTKKDAPVAHLPAGVPSTRSTRSVRFRSARGELPRAQTTNPTP